VLFTIGPFFEEHYGVALNLETAVEYAETLLVDRLQNEPGSFDGTWLLKFVRVDLVDIDWPESEQEKQAVVRRYGIDIEAAIRDYKQAHRNKVEYWLESVFDADTCTLKKLAILSTGEGG
jgi:hypothetical protein